jgi:hypothetical protein
VTLDFLSFSGTSQCFSPHRAWTTSSVIDERITIDISIVFGVPTETLQEIDPRRDLRLRDGEPLRRHERLRHEPHRPRARQLRRDRQADRRPALRLRRPRARPEPDPERVGLPRRPGRRAGALAGGARGGGVIAVARRRRG